MMLKIQLCHHVFFLNNNYFYKKFHLEIILNMILETVEGKKQHSL